VNAVWRFQPQCLRQERQREEGKGRPGDRWRRLDVDGDCADTKLIVSWLLGARDMDAALAFTHDLESTLLE